MAESCISFLCISVPSHLPPQFPCFWWEKCLPALLLHHSVCHLPFPCLKLSLAMISLVVPFWDALTLTIGNTAWEAKGEPGVERERGTDLHSCAVHPEDTGLVAHHWSLSVKITAEYQSINSCQASKKFIGQSNTHELCVYYAWIVMLLKG